MNGGNGKEQSGSERLDRIERALELLVDDHIQFADEHKKLLTAQILLTDRVDKLAQAQAVTEQRFQETDERIGILIKMMDDWIHKQPPPAETR